MFVLLGCGGELGEVYWAILRGLLVYEEGMLWQDGQRWLNFGVWLNCCSFRFSIAIILSILPLIFTYHTKKVPGGLGGVIASIGRFGSPGTTEAATSYLQVGVVIVGNVLYINDA